jgi:hypothetical protein
MQTLYTFSGGASGGGVTGGGVTGAGGVSGGAGGAGGGGVGGAPGIHPLVIGRANTNIKLRLISNAQNLCFFTIKNLLKNAVLPISHMKPIIYHPFHY